MADLVSYIKNMPAFHSRIAATPEEISSAEAELNLQFSKEYTDYLASFGAASVYGHEFTGICSAHRLSIVSVTQAERAANHNIPLSWYVIEQTNIDGITIWQDHAGNIYQSNPMSAGVKIAPSMLDYLNDLHNPI